MAQTIPGVVKHRYDTAANLASANPTPMAGELVIESDTNRMKFGDGSTAYNSIPYQDTIYPIGYVYWQLPGKDSPIDLNFFGTWENISDEFPGDFFRAEGGNASTFESGEQSDAFQGHWHDQWDLGQGVTTLGSSGKILSGTNNASDNTSDNSIRDAITDGTNGTPRTAEETRPVNVTIRIWERTA